MAKSLIFTLIDAVGEFALYSDFETRTAVGLTHMYIQNRTNKTNSFGLTFTVSNSHFDYDYCDGHGLGYYSVYCSDLWNIDFTSFSHNCEYDTQQTLQEQTLQDSNAFLSSPYGQCITQITSGERSVLFVWLRNKRIPYILDVKTGQKLTWNLSDETIKEFITFIERGLCDRNDMFNYKSDYICPERYKHIHVRVTTTYVSNNNAHIIFISDC